jgi:hypothetical protein
MKYTYDISQFKWNATENSFFGAAPFLECLLPDGNIHPNAFPNDKGEFFIHNYKTNEFRRFQFVKEITNWLIDENEHTKYEMMEWLFQSEDGINCYISLH